MANSNAMARADADKNHVGASMLVLDSAGDVGKIALSGKVMAWLCIDTFSTTPVIRGSANISSITDNGAGNITINFTTPMPDTNYVMLFTGSNVTAQGNTNGTFGVEALGTSRVDIRTVNSCNVYIYNFAFGLNDV